MTGEHLVRGGQLGGRRRERGGQDEGAERESESPSWCHRSLQIAAEANTEVSLKSRVRVPAVTRQPAAGPAPSSRHPMAVGRNLSPPRTGCGPRSGGRCCPPSGPLRTRAGGDGGTAVRAARCSGVPEGSRRAAVAGARRGRHGRGLPRHGHAARPRGGDQGAARRLRRDPERLARFEREAQVLASAQPPEHRRNLRSRGVGRRRARVPRRMELVEGETSPSA